MVWLGESTKLSKLDHFCYAYSGVRLIMSRWKVFGSGLFNGGQSLNLKILMVKLRCGLEIKSYLTLLSLISPKQFRNDIYGWKLWFEASIVWSKAMVWRLRRRLELKIITKTF